MSLIRSSSHFKDLSSTGYVFTLLNSSFTHNTYISAPLFAENKSDDDIMISEEL